MTTDERNRLLALADGDLIQRCRTEVFRGSGRGGQKRNVTDSAVRVTLVGAGVAASSDETRSQHTNRGLALRGLRREIAVTFRCPPPAQWTGQWRPAPDNPAFAPWIATVLDVLAANEQRVADTAHFFNLSTSRFVKDIARHPILWQAVNRARTAAGLAPLHG